MNPTVYRSAMLGTIRETVIAALIWFTTSTLARERSMMGIEGVIGAMLTCELGYEDCKAGVWEVRECAYRSLSRCGAGEIRFYVRLYQTMRQIRGKPPTI
jgi:hypothetical protein